MWAYLSSYRIGKVGDQGGSIYLDIKCGSEFNYSGQLQFKMFVVWVSIHPEPVASVNQVFAPDIQQYSLMANTQLRTHGNCSNMPFIRFILHSSASRGHSQVFAPDIQANILMANTQFRTHPNCSNIPQLLIQSYTLIYISQLQNVVPNLQPNVLHIIQQPLKFHPPLHLGLNGYSHTSRSTTWAPNRLVLSVGALIGSQLFVHIVCTPKLLIMRNTCGWVRSANLSNSRTCHFMHEFVLDGHNVQHYGALEVNI